MSTFWIACTSVMLSVAAQFLLKAGMSSKAASDMIEGGSGVRAWVHVLVQPSVILGFALYGLGAVVWLLVLARWDVSKAYPLVGLGFIGTVAVGVALGESVSLVRFLGVLLICGGVALVARS